MTPRRQKSQTSTPSSFDDYPELATLVAAKRMNLSFDELNMMSMSDYLDFTEMWLGDEDEDENAPPRPATQADIDRMFG